MHEAEHDMLVIDAQDGSTRALDALVRHHHRDLLRFAYSRCRDVALAQDAVQDAWMTIARRLRRLDDPRAFRGWLYRAVRWRVIDLTRRADEHGADLDRVAEPSDAGAASTERDRHLDLATAIDRLETVDRETLQLFYINGLTIPEIAQVLDIAPGTIKSRLHRARGQLKQIMTGDDDEH